MSQVTGMEEVTRILALPKRDQPDIDLTPVYRRPHSTARLRPVQSWALDEIRSQRGLLGPIGVGEGKTLIAFLAPLALGAKRPLLLVPASVYPQVMRMYSRYTLDWTLPPITTMTYQGLSGPQSAEKLLDLDPDCIICDEAHALKDVKAARTMRILRFLLERPVPFIALSGTMTRRSLLDFAHLSRFALGDFSPLPRERYALDAWARCLDAEGEAGLADWRYVRPLLDGRWTGKASLDRVAARVAFGERLRATPGVVATSEKFTGSSLYFRRIEDVPYPTGTYEDVEELDERPDGQPFEADVDRWRCLYQLSLGYYYVWDWGERAPDEEWIMARRRWMREVRAEVDRAADWGIDSPALVEEAVRRGEKNRAGLVDALLAWDRVSDREPPDTVPIWVDEEPLDGVVALLGLLRRDGRRPVAWYSSLAVAEGLRRRRIRVIDAGEEPPMIWQGPVALSIESHGKGLNLQAYDAMLVVEPPGSSDIWEQMVGRLHRPGQPSDDVLVWVLTHTPVFRQGLAKALQEAAYVESTGAQQRLCYGDWVTA